MKTITFKQQFTFPAESVKGFALFLGWTESLKRTITVVDESDGEGNPIASHFEEEEYPNPETYSGFVAKKAREHSLNFTKQWAQKLKEDAKEEQLSQLRDSLEPQLHEQIIKPVEDSLVDEFVENDIV